MPHVPRRQGQESAPVTRDDKAPLAKHLGLDTLSLRKWEAPAKDVYKIMFGREPVIDPATGQMVHVVEPQGAKK